MRRVAHCPYRVSELGRGAGASGAERGAVGKVGGCGVAVLTVIGVVMKGDGPVV